MFLVKALEGIIPAYAGSTKLPGRVRLPGRDHPRIRGEHPSKARVKKATTIIPAYAGSTRRPGCRGPCGADHPRIRGEH